MPRPPELIPAAEDAVGGGAEFGFVHRAIAVAIEEPGDWQQPIESPCGGIQLGGDVQQLNSGLEYLRERQGLEPTSLA